MNRIEELTLNLADDVLTDAEDRELEALLVGNEPARSTHIRILQIEAGLRAERQNPEFAASVMARLRSQVAESVTRNVMTQIKTQPTPEWMRKQISEPDATKPDSWVWPFPAHETRSSRREEAHSVSDQRSQSLLTSAATVQEFMARTIISVNSVVARWARWSLKRAWLPLAACLALAVGLALWCFGPTMGEPVLADVQGLGLVLERSGQRLPATAGVRLQPGDVLRTPEHVTAVIGYAPEQTRITLQPETELQLASVSRGKLFDLHLGKLEASVARQRPFQPMVLKTPQAEARVVGTRFTLNVISNATRLDVTEGKVGFTRASDGAAVRVAAGNYAVAAPDYELAALPLTGSILREYWTNLPGDYSIVLLPSNPNFPDHPNGRDYLSKFEAPSDWGTNYGARICGYLLPPLTGDYTFWIAAGDGGELFLSPDDNPENKQQIAYAETTSPREWTQSRSQQSAPITLKAGRKYYIEALQKQGTRKDHLAVAWQGPGRERDIIPGEFLSPLKTK